MPGYVILRGVEEDRQNELEEEEEPFLSSSKAFLTRKPQLSLSSSLSLPSMFAFDRRRR